MLATVACNEGMRCRARMKHAVIATLAARCAANHPTAASCCPGLDFHAICPSLAQVPAHAARPPASSAGRKPDMATAKKLMGQHAGSA